MAKQLSAAQLQRKINKEKVVINNEWYSLRSMLGNDWAMFLMLLGGREAGKSYAVTSFFVCQWKMRSRPFYWMRLSDESRNKLLMNNADKLIDPDIRRRWNLDLVTNGDCVYEVTKRSKPDAEGKTKIIEKKLMARVMSLATFYNDKGSGLFDADFLKDPNMYYNICLDEMNREKSEKKSFDIVYSFTNQLENLVRSTKKRLRVICIGNTLEEASDILCAFNFLPNDFGRYYLRKKRCVIDYIAPSEKYLSRRKGTIADILMPNESTFTNRIETDESLIANVRPLSPTMIIKFSKNKEDWFTLWDGKIIAKYKNERIKNIIAMRPYIDTQFNAKLRDTVFTNFDQRVYQYKNLISFKMFQKQLELLKPRK